MRNSTATILLLLILFFANLNTSVYANTVKPFPKDTLQTFIQNYGKDSLLKLIDTRILLAKNAVIKYSVIENENIEIKSEDLNIKKFFSDSKDTSIIRYTFSNYIEKLLFLDTVNSLSVNKWNSITNIIKKSKNPGKLLRDSINNTMELFVLTAYLCPYLQTNIVLDNTKPYQDLFDEKLIEEKLFIYRYIAMIDKNCHDSKWEEYKNDYFNALYKRCSYLEYFKNLSNFEKLNFGGEMKMYMDTNEEYNNYLRFVTYSVYANNINLKDHSNDLMQVLFSQTIPFGYWLADYVKKEDGLLSSTIYGYWTLLQFRELLLADK